MPDFLRRVNAQPLIFFGTLALIVAILWFAKSVLVPLALAVLLTFCLAPLVRLVQKHGLRRRPAVILVAGAAFILLGLLVWSILSQFVDLAKNHEHYANIAVRKIESLVGERQRPGTSIQTSVKKVLTGTEKQVQPDTDKSPKKTIKAEDAEEPAVPVVVRTEVGGLLSFYATTAAEVIQIVASVSLVIILVFTMLIYREELRDRFIRLTGSGRLTVTTKALDEAAQRISDYLLRKLLVNGVYGFTLCIILLLFGVQFAVLWGVLLVVLRFIPGIGIWLSATPPLVLTLIAFESWWPLVCVAAFFLVAEIVSLNAIEPFFLGRQIGLLPVATMVSLTFWTWLWGPVGLLLAIPITVCLAVLGKHVEPLGFLTILLSDRPAMNIQLRYYQRLLAGDDDEAAEIVELYQSENPHENIYDDLLIPALGDAQRDFLRGELKPEDMKFFFRTTNELLDDFELTREQEFRKLETIQISPRCIIGIPVRNEGDALALRMIEQRSDLKPRTIETCSPGLLSSEVVSWVEGRAPLVVCITSVGPKDVAQTKFLAKRLRAHFPDLTIVVSRLGDRGTKQISKELESLGADHVCGSIIETRQALSKAIQHKRFLQARQEHEFASPESNNENPFPATQ